MSELSSQLVELRRVAESTPGEWSDALALEGGLLIRWRVVGTSHELALHRADRDPGKADIDAVGHALPPDLVIRAGTTGVVRHTVRLIASSVRVPCRGGCGRMASTEKGAFPGFCSECSGERWEHMREQHNRFAEGRTA